MDIVIQEEILQERVKLMVNWQDLHLFVPVSYIVLFMRINIKSR